MDIVKLYKNIVLPWRKRAERAEAMCEIQSDLIHRMSHRLDKELKNRR